jgi:PucR family transcriptional regulator, purine catabolism regulatory protein
MSASRQEAEAALDLGALEAITEAVESGHGLPEVVRAAARALDASLILIDRSSAVLAVAARSSADERALMADVAGVATHELRVGDAAVGRLRVRGRAGEPSAALLRLVTTLIAGEVERLRAPERASEAAQAGFLRAVLHRNVTDRGDIVARAAELGVDVESGAAVIVVRAHHYAPAEEDWRRRVLAAAERAARAAAPGSIAAIDEHPHDSAGQVLVLAPAADETAARRAAEAVARELQAALHTHSFSLGYSRVALDPADLYRAGNEALLAANVAEAQPADAESDGPALLAFEATGAYRLLLPAMSEDPGELQRFYAETVEPLAAYDEQYETDLVQTLETFLECDGNVANTAQRLYTHRHTIRYRLERVRDLCGLDVSSTDGREKLGLGLKAMRVLGIAAPRGPASERGARGGRVPRGGKER